VARIVPIRDESDLEAAALGESPALWGRVRKARKSPGVRET
jgi:hypothetical protein